LQKRAAYHSTHYLISLWRHAETTAHSIQFTHLIQVNPPLFPYRLP
jgi:hypothetical protein